MKPHRIGVRVSADLYALLTLTGEVSAATRALIILGADAVGYELGALRDEAASLLAIPLDPPLRDAIHTLLVTRADRPRPPVNTRPTSVEPLEDTRPTSVEPLVDSRPTSVEPALNTFSLAPDQPFPVDDPLADLGIAV